LLRIYLFFIKKQTKKFLKITHFLGEFLENFFYLTPTMTLRLLMFIGVKQPQKEEKKVENSH